MSFSITGRPQTAPLAVAAPKMQRKLRKPNHAAYVHFRPMVLQPFLCAPVVPGETLKNVLFQARVMTTPITHQLTGWWLETYWFYVKHRHMAGADQYTAMMLDLEAAPTGASGAMSGFGIKAGQVPFVRDAYVAVVNEFFRDETELVSDTITAPVAARMRQEGWWDSLMNKSEIVDGSDLGDDTIGGAALDTVGELSRALETYQLLQAQGLTQLDYDTWLRSFGVHIATPQDDRPELIRYTKEWQYPSNAVSVDADAQRVSSVVSWSLTERIDKDRFFREPGCILGLVLARPKLLIEDSNAGQAIGYLDNAITWSTPLARGSMFLPLKAGITGDTAWDSRDLFLHGDHFVYRAVTGVTPPTIPLVEAQASPKVLKAPDYLTTAQANALFVDGADGYLKMDAIAALSIASASFGHDVTPRTP